MRLNLLLVQFTGQKLRKCKNATHNWNINLHRFEKKGRKTMRNDKNGKKRLEKMPGNTCGIHWEYMEYIGNTWNTMGIHGIHWEYIWVYERLQEWCPPRRTEFKRSGSFWLPRQKYLRGPDRFRTVQTGPDTVQTVRDSFACISPWSGQSPNGPERFGFLG